MDCIFNEFSDINDEIILVDEAFRHLIALRIRINEEILITNGQGLTLNCYLKSISKKSATLLINEVFTNMGESSNKIALGIGLLDNRDRFEFALEKSIELGLTEFFPIQSKNSSKKNYDSNRLKNKAVSAICQSKRSILPIINDSISISKLINEYSSNYDKIYLADIEGDNINDFKFSTNSLILIGPEGGFTNEEIDIICKQTNTQKIRLGIRRLRAETAAISLISAISLKI